MPTSSSPPNNFMKTCPTCGETCRPDDPKCDECGHDLPPVPALLNLTCCCCGDEAPAFKQWWNRDTGYGLCGRCAHSIQHAQGTAAMAAAEFTSCYGHPGVHWFPLKIAGARAIVPAMNNENGLPAEVRKFMDTYLVTEADRRLFLETYTALQSEIARQKFLADYAESPADAEHADTLRQLAARQSASQN